MEEKRNAENINTTENPNNIIDPNNNKELHDSVSNNDMGNIRNEPLQQIIPKSPDRTGNSLVNEVNLSEIIRRENERKGQKADKLYQQIWSITLKIIKSAGQKADISQLNYSELLQPLDKTIDFIINGDRDLLDMACRQSVSGRYNCQLINVGITSLYVGQNLKYNKIKLAEFGVLAFLHEIKPETPAVDAFDFNKNNSITPAALAMFKRILYMGAIIIPALRHEKTKLKHSTQFTDSELLEIIEYARIISLVYSYSSGCYQKNNQLKMTPELIMKKLIETCTDSDKNIVKILIKLVGLYPTGSWVELNTGVIAQVKRINKVTLLRPVVQTVFDKNGNRLQEKTMFDLSRNQSIYITKSISHDDLKQSDSSGISLDF